MSQQGPFAPSASPRVKRRPQAQAYLVDGRQVAVGICKGGVDLDGPRVALQRSLNVLHFL